MRIAYFINQYPKVSHSFIRREILGLEAQGVDVLRYSVQRDVVDVVDAADLTELDKTTYISEQQKLHVIGIVFRLLIRYPFRWIQSFASAVRLGRHSHSGVLRHLIYFIEACVLLDSLNQHSIQHVHAHFGTNSTTVIMLAKLLGNLTYSFTVHGPEEFDKPEALSLGDKIHHASFVIAISSFCRSQLFRWCDHDCWKKIHIVHCALDADFLEASATSVPDNHRLVCVGRLCEQKGQLLLLEAIHRIKEKGVSVELVMAGDGPMRGEIEQLIGRYHLAEQVRITGWISSEQILQEIVASRALVLPSFAEGLPVVIMEACALRRPVITTYIAGIPELIRHQDSGFLIPAGSIDAISAMILALFELDVAKLNDIGNRAYMSVCEDHNIHTECAKLKRLFQTQFDLVEN